MKMPVQCRRGGITWGCLQGVHSLEVASVAKPVVGVPVLLRPAWTNLRCLGHKSAKPRESKAKE